MAKRIKREKSLFNPDSLEASIELCRISGEPYTVTVSNYTTLITGFLNKKYIKEEKNPACFIGASRIKADIVKSNIHVDINKDEVRYYDSNLQPMKTDKIFNVDLKSAYATILRNSGLITNKTFNYICSLSKPDRLAAVGMLASHKYNFNYIHDNIESFSEEKNEMEAYFYFCVNKTFEIMTELKKICGKSYLFCWVDSVYYSDYSKTKEVVKYLKSIKFHSSFEILSKVEVTDKDNHFTVEFFKEGKIKSFNIPKNEDSFARHIIAKHVKAYNYGKTR